ncbi:MAG TPA: transposase [Cyanobacteria bacterium UBA11370]|nr:transposase [Cyanobacteria bacterium UBA11370]HBY79269.1 transposase [Cyanobacteria bacterium UBA11148]
MLVFECKLKGKTEQFNRIDEAIRTGQFIRNSCLKYWQENKETTKNDLQKYCAVLAANPDFSWAKKLNSQARQAHADRAWFAISRFCALNAPRFANDNGKNKVPGKKGYPKFKKNSHSVEYKTTGWKLSEERKRLTLTDGFNAGTFKLKGSRNLHFYQLKQIKRIRIIKRADGYYAQFLIDVERSEEQCYTGTQVGLDVGLASFYTDSNGNKVDNPRYLRKSERQLNHLVIRLSRRYQNPNKGKKGEKMSKTKIKQSKRFHKARIQVARQHLDISRQRKDFVVKTARCVIQSNDLVAYEDLKVRNMVKNRKLAKSISDASWSSFREWLEYFAKVFNKVVIAVPPHYTSQNCSCCGEVVKKSLSVRTHSCPSCKTVLDRDENAALNILMKALEVLGINTVGHTGINAQGQTNPCLVGENLLGKLTG